MSLSMTLCKEGPVVLSGKGTRLGSSRTEAKASIPKSHQIWSIFATMSPV